MSISDRFNKDETSENKQWDTDMKAPNMAAPASALQNDELSDDELEGIAAAGMVTGTQDDDSLRGGTDADTLEGLTGDDTLDGGYRDNADDVAYGGAGDDVYIWGLKGDGNDTFHGGEGHDKLELDLPIGNTDTLKEAYDIGTWTIELTDGDGNSIEITDAMWDVTGNLQLPEGASGVIVGLNGNTMTFDGVEVISVYDAEDDSITGTGGDDHLLGTDGEDVLKGGGGDDTLDGGRNDNADDVAYGGVGNDVFVWGLTGDGNDTFHGGAGSDTLELDLPTVGSGSIQDAYDNGEFSIELTDSEGNSVTVTDAMWDADGSLQLPEGVKGVIMGPDGNTVTFDNVEVISVFGFVEGTKIGTDGHDYLKGTDGEDVLKGGRGDDTLDGGLRDNADDVAYGGAGYDVYIWGLTDDGNDTFHGGADSDTLKLDLSTIGFSSIMKAYDAGEFSIELTDSDGNSVTVTDAMWDADGNLQLPEGVSGVITGPDGNTVTFSGVETIAVY